MQYIQKRRKRLSGHLPNLRLIHQRVVKQTSSILLFNIGSINTLLFAILVLLLILLRHSSRDVEPHLNQLIFRGPCLTPFAPCAPKMAIRASLIATSRQREFNGYLIFPGQVRIRDFWIWYFERWSVLDIEHQLRFTELAFAPIPAAKGVLLVLKVDAVEEFEGFGDAIEVLPK